MLCLGNLRTINCLTILHQLVQQLLCQKPTITPSRWTWLELLVILEKRLHTDICKLSFLPS
uniref:Uncharacterized protein n=1 Tax=Rhizophora mucronata TaxID=61149 RepID=A0A2P2IWT2_RHIMU